MAFVALPGSTMEKKLKHRLLDEVMAPRHVGHLGGRTRHWRRRQTATFCPEKIEMIVDHGRSPSGIYVSIIFGDDHPPDLQFCLWTCWSTKGFGVFLHLEGQNQTDKGLVDIAYLHVSRSLMNLSMYIDIWWILCVQQHFWVFDNLKSEQTTEHRSQDASVTPGMVDLCRPLWRWKIHGMKDATYTISLDGRFRLLSI